MAENPSKDDIIAVFKRLRSIPTNKQCFDCGAKNPTWSSVTYGVFICIDCSAKHRNLGVHLSFVRSTNLDTTYTWVQLRSMQLGGNQNATAFFAQHGVSGQVDVQQKYNGRAASLYREKLHSMASQAMKTHGTKLWIDEATGQSPLSPDSSKDDFDFFKSAQQTKIVEETPESLFSNNVYNNNIVNNNNRLNAEPEGGPNVDNMDSSDSWKPAPTVKKVGALGAKRVGGIGARKAGGLGAQKASVNFDELEKEAKRKEELKAQMAAQQKLEVGLSKEQEEKEMARVRLAYHDVMSSQQKKMETKMKTIDPKKAEQAERLGMGFGSGQGVSHSAMSDMMFIGEDDSEKEKPKRSSFVDTEDNDFEIVGTLKSLGFGGPPKYSDSPFSRSNKSKEDWGSSTSEWTVEKKSDWSSSSISDNWLDELTEKKAASKKSSSTDFSSFGKRAEGGSSRTVPKSATLASISAADSNADTTKKFANAKSISSEQFFGDGQGQDYETRANLSRFEGSNAISSSDYFGNSSNDNGSSSSISAHAPNLYDIKEGLRDGATMVASRLSSIASGVMRSLQE